MWLRQIVLCAEAFARASEGSKKLASRATSAITTSSSSKVKPRLGARVQACHRWHPSALRSRNSRLGQCQYHDAEPDTGRVRWLTLELQIKVRNLTPTS